MHLLDVKILLCGNYDLLAFDWFLLLWSQKFRRLVRDVDAF